MSIECEKDVVEPPPQHLNVEFFSDVLENVLRKADAQVQRIKFTMGSTTGENYCSQIFRVKLHYIQKQAKPNGNIQTESVSVIVKCIPHTEATDFLQDLQVFLKEKIFYFDVLPRMEILLDNGEKFGARLYHYLKQPINTLVFEDLKVNNFEMASRENGLNEMQSRSVMRKLGQFHAISMILAKRDPEIMKHFNKGMLAKIGLTRDDGKVIRFFSRYTEALIELIKHWPGYEVITQKIQHYIANLQQNLCRCQEPRPNEIKVLNHGDLWVNNILFKSTDNNGNQIEDTIFVDFQLSIWGSPGIDLNYFFYTSLTLDVLKEKREQLIREYYQMFSATLERFDYDDIPSYQQICDEVRQRELYGFFANHAIYPLISMEKEMTCDTSIENLTNDEFAHAKITQMYKSKRLEESFRYTLPRFEKLGIWDN